MRTEVRTLVDGESLPLKGLWVIEFDQFIAVPAAGPVLVLRCH